MLQEALLSSGNSLQCETGLAETQESPIFYGSARRLQSRPQPFSSIVDVLD
jgi:hypothetical protein